MNKQQELENKRICLNCDYETDDTPCPMCGSGVFSNKSLQDKIRCETQEEVAMYMDMVQDQEYKYYENIRKDVR